jgi:hypothetical protein
MRRALLAILFLLPAAASAQRLYRFELTPIAGYRLAGDFNAESDSGFDPRLKVKVEESAIYGALFDVPLGEAGWQLEVLANRQRSSFVVDHGLLDPSTRLGDVTIDHVHVGLLYQWGRGQVNPYLALTGGVGRIVPEFANADAEDRFAGSLAGGVKIFFTPNVGLRLEARGYWTDLGTGFRNRDRRYDSGEGLYQGEGSAGLILAW